MVLSYDKDVRNGFNNTEICPFICRRSALEHAAKLWAQSDEETRTNETSPLGFPGRPSLPINHPQLAVRLPCHPATRNTRNARNPESRAPKLAWLPLTRTRDRGGHRRTLRGLELGVRGCGRVPIVARRLMALAYFDGWVACLKTHKTCFTGLLGTCKVLPVAGSNTCTKRCMALHVVHMWGTRSAKSDLRPEHRAEVTR